MPYSYALFLGSLLLDPCNDKANVSWQKESDTEKNKKTNSFDPLSRTKQQAGNIIKDNVCVCVRVCVCVCEREREH